jgi:competence ComEA-like helix-hairpin-helix protein
MKKFQKSVAIVFFSCLALPVFAMTGKVNVNKANEHTLMTKLTGVNRTQADRIISYRKKNGDYVGLYDLGFVKGIGRSFFKSNYDHITVGNVSLADKKHDPFDPNAKG